ncbi:MAG: VWA domain-containing protein [Verrucomicrobiae bacterium]|nr:VWA domain-containing protein [Verrucomicrobiae bacterium]
MNMEPKRKTSRLSYWIIVAILGSLVVHTAIWFWFQRLYLPQTGLPSYEKLVLRKFRVERVQINPKWLEPKLPPPEKPAPAPGTDRAALIPSPETRSFSKMLSQTPSSPTLPSGAPAIPQDKPRLTLGDERTTPPDLFGRSKLEQESQSTREQLSNTGKSASAGRPILNTPGAPVVPKAGSPEAGLPTQSRVGPSQGTEIGVPSGFGPSNRVEDFFGIGGGLPPLPPPEPPKPATEAAKAVPQGLPADKPKSTQQFESLNPFLDVELFTEERTPPQGRKEGYFLIKITAKPNKQLKVFPKDVLFILDISSSIGPTRLESFRASVLNAITNLNPADRFKILVFRDRLNAFSADWMNASQPPLDEIRSWLGKLRSAGVTDLYDSLRPIADNKREAGRMNMILLMSDGVPTKGVLDSTQIINELSEANDNKSSIFAMSAGLDVNNFLLDLLSYRNQGWLRTTPQVKEAPDKFGQLIQQTRNPLFLNLRFRFAGVDGEQVYPQNLPNLYQESPLLLFGRHSPGQTTPISLQVLGENVEGTRELLVQLPLPPKPTGPANIPSTWARQRIYHLLGCMTRIAGSQGRILDDVRQLSEDYKVEVPYF